MRRRPIPVPTLLLAIAIVVGPVTPRSVQAATNEVQDPAASDPAAPDPALADAQRLYGDGVTDYETFDYDIAIEKWKEALSRLRDADPQTPEQIASVAAARNAIVYNIARAQEKAYQQDHDVVRLKKAQGLLERYVEEYTAAGGDDAEEVARARARIAELAAQIDAAEKEAAPKPGPKSGGTKSDKPAGRGFVIGGSVLLVAGVGLVAGGVTAGVLMTQRAEDRLPKLDQLADEPARRDQIARGHRGDIITIACAAAGGAMALAGIGLVAAGAIKSRRAKQPPKHARVAAPMLGPGFAGMMFQTRF